MEIASLRTFVEVMRRRSFTSVARVLDVAPSSVSRVIAGLESELGVRLFQRTTRTLSPTEAALAYFERVEPMVVELERAASVAADSGDAPRGLLRVTAAASFAQVNLVPLLPEFSRRYPELRFELVLADTFLDLVAERVDLAIRLGRLAESSLIAQRLSDIVYVVGASPDYLRKRGRPKSPRDLERHDCLRYPIPGYGARWRFRKGDGEPFEVPISGRIVANDGEALVRCAAAGMGIVMLPRWLMADALRKETLVELFPDHQATASEFDLAVWMLYPSRSHLPRKVRVFADFLKEKFRAGPPAEAGLAPHPTSRKSSTRASPPRGPRASRRKESGPDVDD
jgi:DNA-binding transcriptional LysR family regulator